MANSGRRSRRARADFKLTFRTPNVVRNIFSDTSSLSFGEAYIYWRPWGSRFAD